MACENLSLSGCQLKNCCKVKSTHMASSKFLAAKALLPSAFRASAIVHTVGGSFCSAVDQDKIDRNGE